MSSLKLLRNFQKQAEKAGKKRGKLPMTSGGGNFAGGFLNRNKRSAQWAVATNEVAGKRSAKIPPQPCKKQLDTQTFHDTILIYY